MTISLLLCLFAVFTECIYMNLLNINSERTFCIVAFFSSAVFLIVFCSLFYFVIRWNPEFLLSLSTFKINVVYINLSLSVLYLLYAFIKTNISFGRVIFLIAGSTGLFDALFFIFHIPLPQNVFFTGIVCQNIFSILCFTYFKSDK